MTHVRKYLFLVIIIIFIHYHHCARYRGGGSSRGGGRPTSSPRQTTRRWTTSRAATTGRSVTTARSFTTSRSITTARTYASDSAPSRTPGWNLPPRPGSQNNPGYQGPNKVKIENNYNYHYPGYYSLPVQSGHPGYYQAPPYRYSSFDTGSTALGLFLGYGLAKLTTPTYSHYSYYDGFTPRYDHYEVHHYYHNRDSVPKSQDIPANTIVGCVGDTVTVCPGNTTSLCTSSGALMCVVSATSTVPCTDNTQVNCVKSTISCVNNTAPECKNSDQNFTSISIPCVSSAKILGDVKVQNNTITADKPVNSTSTSNGTESGTSSTSTDLNATTVASVTSTSEATTEGSKIEKQQDFCVTVVALPAKKKDTEGEKVLEEAKGIFSNFIENVWGL